MPTLKDIERIFVCETNAVENPPFSTSLTPGGTVELCKVTVPVGRERNAFLIHAMVDWSVTFTGLAVPVAIDAPGSAQVTFELLRDGGPIQRVTETAIQTGFNIFAAFVGPTTTFVTSKLLHVDTPILGGNTNFLSTFTLRATNIILTAPIFGIVPSATVTAAAGPVALVIEEIDTCRAQALDIK